METITGTKPWHTRAKHLVRRLLLATFAVAEQLDRRGDHSVLLTFDDGPHPDVTPQVLDRLREYQARAVFFVIGDLVRRHPATLRRILDEGHLVGNHTDTHQNHGLAWRPYREELRRCQAAVEAVIGRAPELFRPPRGQLTPASILLPPLLGLRTVLWSVDPHDYRLRTPADAVRCARQLAESLSGGDIILLHDDHAQLPAILDILLPRLTERGLDLSRGVDCLRRAQAPSPPASCLVAQ